jgi:hypothetical protein
MCLESANKSHRIRNLGGRPPRILLKQNNFFAEIPFFLFFLTGRNGVEKAQTSIRCKPIRSISATHNGWESTNLNPAQTDSPNLSDTVGAPSIAFFAMGGKAQTSIRSEPIPHPHITLPAAG